MGKPGGRHKAAEDGRAADGAAARRPASPTGSSDAARQAALQRCHKKLAASFPHAVVPPASRALLALLRSTGGDHHAFLVQL